jgi:hypothetical protein
MNYMCRINSLVSLRPLLAISIALIMLFALAPVSLAGPTKQINPNLINKPNTLTGPGRTINPGLINPGSSGSSVPSTKMVSPNVLAGMNSHLSPGKLVNPNIAGKIPAQNLPPGNTVPGNTVPGNTVPGNYLPGNYPGGMTNINIGLSPGVVSAAPGGWYQSAPSIIGIVPFNGQCVLNERTGTYETAYGAPAWSDGKNMWVQSAS